MYIVLWVFSRAGALLQATKVFTSRRQSFGEHSDHFLVNLKNLSNELFVACPHWKENMRPSSRDYSINTATLDPTKPKTWLLRAVLAIHALLLRPLRDPKDAAQCFRDKVMNLGPFIAQHVIWAFQLLGIVEYENDENEWTWASLRYYTSTRDTLKLFACSSASPKKHQLKRTMTKMLRLLNFSGSEH